MTKSINSILPLAALALGFSLLTAGCGGGGTYSPVAGIPAVNPPPVVTIRIVSPNPATTYTGGGTLDYQAVVTGSDNTSVTWQVVSENGGSINSSGVYTSGSQAGVFTIEAISQADPTKTATATATVTVAQGSVGGTIH